jgi:phosphate-selective porin OprO/OprP
MKPTRALPLAAAVQAALLFGSAPAFAKPAHGNDKDARIEALERRLLLLEQRLAESEAHNRQLSETKAAEKPAEAPLVKQLDQKVKTLERKLEVDKEMADAARKTTPKLEAGAEGVRFISADGDHTVRLRGSVQADAKFFMDDNADKPKDASTAIPGVTSTRGTNLPDRFELRQARVWLEGSLWKKVDFKIMPEFGGGNVRLFDAYIDAHYFPFASLTAGKYKPPVSLERLQGDADGAFLERAFPTYLAANRDIGVMLHGEFAKPGYSTVYGGPVDFKNFLSYQLGVFNGAGDNGLGDTDIDDDKEFAGRLWAHPFQHSGIEPLEGLGIGISGTWELPRQKTTFNNLVDEIGQSRIVDYSATGFTKSGTNIANLVADGDHYRVYPQAYWYWGPFGLMGEYVLSSQRLAGQELDDKNNPLKAAAIQQNNTAWQVQASYVVTGEDNTFQSVKPRAPFDPSNGNWGALQLVARWSELDIDDKSFARQPVLTKSSGVSYASLLDPHKSVSQATTWSVGANWFLNRNFRVMADYEQTYFQGGAGTLKSGVQDRPTEKVFGTRFQLVF